MSFSEPTPIGFMRATIVVVNSHSSEDARSNCTWLGFARGHTGDSPRIADGVAVFGAALSAAGNGAAAERIFLLHAGDWKAQPDTLEGWLEEMWQRPSR